MRWFRFYDDAINDPKILKLSEDLRWHWVAVLCIASKHDGVLPDMGDIAIMLRVSRSRANTLFTQLAAAGLLDKTETGFAPHNWDGRQYKSDVSTGRVKRFRNAKRNVSETPPETEADTDAETDIPEAKASGAGAPRDVRSELFNRGLETLARLTGKGPDACRSFVGKCLKAASDDAVTVLGLIEDAERNRVVDPSAWIASRLKPSTGPPGRPLTEFQRGRQELKGILNDLHNFSERGDQGSGANLGLLPGNSGERSEAICGGIGENVIDLPASSYRSGG